MVIIRETKFSGMGMDSSAGTCNICDNTSFDPAPFNR